MKKKDLLENRWRCETFDSHLLNEKQFSLFNQPGPHELVEDATRKFEEPVIEWIFNKTNFQYLLFEEIGLSNAYKHFLSCRKYLLDNEHHEPDIDILLVNEQTPHQSVAFQAKRLPIGINADGSPDFKREPERRINEVISQANKVFKKYKYYKNYIILLVVIDGRNKIEVNQIYRQPDFVEMYRKIYSLNNFRDINEHIGIFAYEITQPTNEKIDFTGTISTKELKPAKIMEQSSRLTERVLQHVRWCNDFKH